MVIHIAGAENVGHGYRDKFLVEGRLAERLLGAVNSLDVIDVGKINLIVADSNNWTLGLLKSELVCQNGISDVAYRISGVGSESNMSAVHNTNGISTPNRSIWCTKAQELWMLDFDTPRGPPDMSGVSWK